MAVNRLDSRMKAIKMRPVEALTDARSTWTWETKKGLDGGTLFIGHIDVPLQADVPVQTFRRDPEWLYGEGIGISRGPLVMLEFALKALRHNRMLHQLPIGVLYYLDEGRDCRYSADIIRSAVSRAKRVFVLRPGGKGDAIRIQRRGQRKYRLVAESQSHRIGYSKKVTSVMPWCNERFLKLDALSSRKDRLAVAVVDMKVDTYRMSVPHRISATLIVSYLHAKVAEATEAKIKDVFGKGPVRWRLELISDRPPMRDRRINHQLAKSLAHVAEKWDIPLGEESSLIPTAAGLVPSRVPVVCGIGPVTSGHYSPQEAIKRVSLIQRTLLIAGFLAKEIKKDKK
jgi:D-alanine-D-alanine ligase